MNDSTTQEQHIIDYIKGQLRGYGYTDTEGKSKKELTTVLARYRAMEININTPENNWW